MVFLHVAQWSFFVAQTSVAQWSCRPKVLSPNRLHTGYEEMGKAPNGERP